MSPSERVSIYLPDRLRAVLDVPEGKQGLSARIAAVIDRYQYVTQRAAPALSRAEWCLVLDACNGWAAWAEAGETLMTGLAAEVEDHVRTTAAHQKWGLTAEQCADLVRRLRDTDGAGTMAVIERVERFWRRPDLHTDAAMAAAGIQLSD